ncbi:uncharacterized protein TM35_001201070 [Trypanosoma theileri]|uniref:Uncharacterized protein n=1 Tax=Trypanosoma theileri TaxID=67003 RepID=A0A1X0NFJ5_9TRYP|nr:uncharacterized protein TM35_001201070 [Trypanosoma theileri]ORC81345.1 hypothetical protein TM35_001201070 [Trypanosoma theileri]
MATMFIQLRRLVYLLVLLHCCVCVVRADGEDTKEERYREKVWHLRNTTIRAYARLVEGRGCLNAWREMVRTSNESYKRAHSAAKLTEEIAAKVKVMKEKLEASASTFTGWEDVGSLLDEVKETTSDVEERIKEAERKALSIKRAGDFCKVEYDNAVNVMDELYKAQYMYEELFEPGRKPKSEWTKDDRLVENSTDTHGQIKKFIAEFDLFRGEAQVSKVNALIQVKEAKDSIEKTAKRFKELKEEIEKSSRDGDEKLKSSRVKDKVTEMAEAVAKAGKIEEPKKKELLSAAVYNVTLMEEREKAVRLVADEVVGIHREKAERARRAAEEAQRERERAQREEEERERRVAEEAQREKERVQKEREERERKVAEEAQRERERARKVAEEEALRERERARKVAEDEAQKESERRMVEGKKKKDNSVGPALVHGPLLLLLVLMCVLGYTLVC